MTRKPGWNRSKKTGRFITKSAWNRWYKKGGKRVPQKRRKVKAKEKYIEFEVGIQYQPEKGGGFTITGETSSTAEPRKRSRIAHAKRNPGSNTKRSGGRKKQSASRDKIASNRLGKRKIKGKRRKKGLGKFSSSDSVTKLKRKNSGRKSKRNPSRRPS